MTDIANHMNELEAKYRTAQKEKKILAPAIRTGQSSAALPAAELNQ